MFKAARFSLIMTACMTAVSVPSFGETVKYNVKIKDSGVRWTWVQIPAGSLLCALIHLVLYPTNIYGDTLVSIEKMVPNFLCPSGRCQTIKKKR